MATTRQTVRVFISLTFRDMHAERDHLFKVVFPELCERLLPHRIELIDIDLGQGKRDVTDIDRLGEHRRNCLDATNRSIH
jgi:hypothetical protein